MIMQTERWADRTGMVHSSGLNFPKKIVAAPLSAGFCPVEAVGIALQRVPDVPDR
jgi:hypothetical protein